MSFNKDWQYSQKYHSKFFDHYGLDINLHCILPTNLNFKNDGSIKILVLNIYAYLFVRIMLLMGLFCGLFSTPVLADPICTLSDPDPAERKFCCSIAGKEGGPDPASDEFKQYCRKPTTDYCEIDKAQPEKIIINAEALNPDNPKEKIISYSTLLSLHNREALGGRLTGETVHIDPDGKATPVPFTRWKITTNVKDSKQKKHKCLTIVGITFPYNPLSIYVSFEVDKCSTVVRKHELKHYNFIDSLDNMVAMELNENMNEIGLPSPRKPVMILAAEVDNTIMKANENIQTRINEMWNSYQSFYAAHKEITDTSQETKEVCDSCSEWPKGICR